MLQPKLTLVLPLVVSIAVDVQTGEDLFLILILFLNCMCNTDFFLVFCDVLSCSKARNHLQVDMYFVELINNEKHIFQ